MKIQYLFVVLALITMVSATSGDLNNIQNVITQFKDLFCNLIPIVFMLAIAASAVIYAGGQMLGAEQRAKTASWAASLFIFAIVAALIYVIGPWIIEQLTGETLDCSTS